MIFVILAIAFNIDSGNGQGNHEQFHRLKLLNDDSSCPEKPSDAIEINKGEKYTNTKNPNKIVYSCNNELKRIKVYDCFLLLYNCSFNKCQYNATDGGAISINIYTVYEDKLESGIKIISCNFTRCYAKNAYGGAISYNTCEQECTFNIIDCIFTENVANYGGAISFDASTVVIDGCTFVDNAATEFGFDICAQDPFSTSTGFTLKNCNFFHVRNFNFNGAMIMIFWYSKTKITFINNYIENNVNNICLFNISKWWDVETVPQDDFTVQSNCMLPEVTRIFQTDGYEYLIKSGDFTNKCEYKDPMVKTATPKPKPVATPSQIVKVPTHVFSNSFLFSNSFYFTKSDAFSRTSKFSASNDFTKSDAFSITSKFSESNDFSKSNPFSVSFVFSQSQIFSALDSSEFLHESDEAPEKEPSKQAPSEQEPSKQEPSKQAPSEQEPSKQEPSKQEPSKQAPSEQEPSKQEPSKQEPSKQEPSKQAPSLDHEPLITSFGSTFLESTSANMDVVNKQAQADNKSTKKTIWIVVGIILGIVVIAIIIIIIYIKKRNNNNYKNNEPSLEIASPDEGTENQVEYSNPFLDNSQKEDQNDPFLSRYQEDD